MSDRHLSPSATAHSPSPSASSAPKIRRRNRIITSCLECRRRKLKCDRNHPCNHCTKAKRDCVFLAPSLDANSKNKLNQFKESVESLEKDLGRQNADGTFTDWNVATATHSPSGGYLSSSSDARSYAAPIEVPADEKGLEPSPLAVQDIVYDDDDNDDLIDDLGIKMGKMRVTERIGGFVRPRFSDEIAYTMRMNPNFEAPSFTVEPPEDSSFSPPNLSDDGNQSWLEPSEDYLAPGLGLTFPYSPSEETSLLNFLPSKDFADRLLERYFLAVDPIAKVVHRPTFTRQYTQFWNDVSSGFEPSSQLQALIFAMQMSASVSMLEDEALKAFGCNRGDMIRTFRTGCEFALSKSQLLRTTKTTTIQAFIMYLVPLCRSEVSRAHASLVSMAIRLAECAGIHRDGTNFGLTPVETHVRRLLWHQLCALDIRTSEAVGPRPAIRLDEYDVKMPLNVDDHELESIVAPTQDAARFTTNTLNRIRCESMELSRMIWWERLRIEKGETSLTAVLRIVEQFKERMVRKFGVLLDLNIPVQAFTALFLQFVTSKAHIGVLHRYVVSTSSVAPKRLQRLVWANGCRQMEACVEWETSPVFKPLYSWYMGAMQQWHTALLFIPLIVSAKEPEPEIDRVWACLDYVFEFDRHLSRSDKMKLAFGVARKRLEELQKQRKARLPTALEQRLGRAPVDHSPSDRKPNLASPTPAGNEQYVGMQDRRPSASSKRPKQRKSSTSDGQLGPGFAQPMASPNAMNVSPSTMNVSPNMMGSFQQLPPSQSPNGGTMASAQPPQPATDFGPLNDVDWDDFDRLFPMENNGVVNQQFFTPGDANGNFGMPQDMSMQPMTFLPDPTWKGSPQPPNTQSQSTWTF